MQFISTNSFTNENRTILLFKAGIGGLALPY